MTDPTGGAPSPQVPPPPEQAPGPPPAAAPAPPPAAAPAPPPGGGNWSTPSGQPQMPAGVNPNFQQAAVEAGPAPGIAYADLMTRIIAYIIDSIILGIGTGIVVAILGAVLFTALLYGGFAMAFVGLVILAAVSLAISAIYFVYTWTTMRASPGQKILNLQTVNAADGATLTRDQAIKRWAFLFGPQAVASVAQIGLGASDIGMLSPLLSLLSLLYVLYLLWTASQSSKRQGFHDVQAGTVVVKRLA